jgi:hypothetical protein
MLSANEFDSTYHGEAVRAETVYDLSASMAKKGLLTRSYEVDFR